MRAIDKIILLITILLLYTSVIIVVLHINSSTYDDEDLRPQPPFNFYAVDHEINNISDMYIGFEFDNSTFTVNVDITNDSVYINAFQTEFADSMIKLKVNNETEGSANTTSPFLMFSASGSDWPYNFYIRWKIVNLQYGANVTFFFSGKGRAIATDRSATDYW